MDLKKEAAATAVGLIKPGQFIGFGAGSTIAYMIDLLAEQTSNHQQTKVITSSFTTRQLLLKKGFTVLSAAGIYSIDIYFDGCDQLNHQFHTLKSGGGIHTQEKLLASMAQQFIIAGDEAKYVSSFTTTCPLVVEMLPQAFQFVPVTLKKLFEGIRVVMRMADKKDGAVITENGNYLLDLYFDSWPDLAPLNPILKNIAGVVETSLFYNMVHKAVIAGKDGTRIIEK